jgi:cytochrome c-type biogenesis protein CcmE
VTPRRRRLLLVCGILAGVSLSVALALTAFRQNVTFYFIPTQVAAGKAPVDEHFRLGGMVSKGSVHRVPGSLEVHFTVTDFKHDVPVTYTGVLPDLFREGQGVIAHGHLDASGVFVADQVLAKHDEKYMPPQMAAQIKAEHGGVMPFGTASDPLHTPSAAPGPAGGAPALKLPPQAFTRQPGSS